MYDIYGNFNNYLNNCIVSPMNNLICNSPIRSNYSELLQSQQYCNQTNINWQLQQMTNCFSNDVERFNSFINTYENKNEENKIIHDNISIKNYMDKEFLYESELKEIEDKFNFKFYNLNINNIKNNKIYKTSEEIIDELKSMIWVEKIEYEYITRVDIKEYKYSKNYAHIYYNNRNGYTHYITKDVEETKEDEEIIMNMCNAIIKSNILIYQQFYEKYKNRIVKDNEYEDLSYYEKILAESC